MFENVTFVCPFTLKNAQHKNVIKTVFLTILIIDFFYYENKDRNMFYGLYKITN